MVKVVDIDKAIKEDGSKFMKSLPQFLVNKIKKTVHQDELNRVHNKYIHLQGMDYVHALLDEWKITVDIERKEQVPKDGRFIYIANHPQGGLDALSYLHCINEVHGDVVSPSNQLFEYIPNLHPVVLGINVFGSSSKERAMAVNKAFEGDRPIMIFPAGAVSRKIKGEIMDLDWHKGFVTKAIQTKRDIIPAYIDSRNSNKFYRFSKFRQMLGIKMTIETIFLPDEMLKQIGSKIKITVGKRVPHQSLTREFSHKQWAEKIKQKVYELR